MIINDIVINLAETRDLFLYTIAIFMVFLSVGWYLTAKRFSRLKKTYIIIMKMGI